MSETTGFSVKEMIVRLDGKLDAVLASLNSKAERSELRDLEARVSSLEASRTASLALSSWQRWFVGAVCVGLVGAVIALVALATGHS
jgi:hypothetical protein